MKLAAVAFVLAGLLASAGMTATPGSVVHRINVGGPTLTGWTADTATAPSPYSNSSATKTYATSTAINVTDPSVPVGTPAAVFQTERWDPVTAPEMQWDLPVEAGAYEVRLYLAEIYSGAMAVGNRVFDVSVEGKLALDDYDVYAAVGGNKGVVKRILVKSDASLDVDFGHVVQNPAVNGIEIVAAAPNQLGALPTNVSFGSVSVGQTGQKQVTLTNVGSAGDPAIVIDSTSITGVEAAQFKDSFDDAGSVTLAPGASAALNVTFAPTTMGAKSAMLHVAQSGANTVSIPLSGQAGAAAPIGFGKSLLAGETSSQVTSLQFGPDGRLYVAQLDGLIKIYTVKRNGPNAYSVSATETLTGIRDIPNHNDDGRPNPSVMTRIVTGILVTGTAANPVIYATSSDPRIGSGPAGVDLGLDTNSSLVSRLTWTGSSWQKLDLVRGLPRSEENHSANGMQFDAATNMLYVAQGGNTNEGAPSNNFALLPEFALSAAILKINLGAIGNTTYDLPTLTGKGKADKYDPFGGNDGTNQAKVVAGGPVQVYAAGFRNAYDLVLTSSGRMYTIDNGGNAGWGGIPKNEGPSGVCTNEISEAGATEPDTLHFVSAAGYYGGHPNPTRGNQSNTFNKQSPVPTANPVECDYRPPSVRGALTSFSASTNGLTEYTASNFGGALKGDLLTASFDNKIYRIELSSSGNAVTLKQALFSTVGSVPLDVTTLGDGTTFPGTIWVGDHGNGSIVVFEPNDLGGAAPITCTGVDSWTSDEDGDGFKNADEIDNGTSPCSAADVPKDADGDKISDLNDPDDDNDTLPDTSDPFAVDGTNGTATTIPVRYSWDNDAPRAGGLLGLGFTGLMTNGTANYESLFDPANMTAGGAAGVTTVDKVAEGDALGTTNTQKYGFQFGVKPPTSGSFTAHTRVLAPFAGLVPQGNQSMGLFVGAGDQDNYVKIVVSANGGPGAVAFLKEAGAVTSAARTSAVALPGPSAIDLYFEVNVAAKTVQPSYVVTIDGTPGTRTLLGAAEPIPAGWFTATRGLAVGIISTSAGPAPEFPASWDFIEVLDGSGKPVGSWESRGKLPVARQEVSFVQAGGKLYLAGGGTNQYAYDPAVDSWTEVAPLPAALDHIQGVEYGARIYYVGGLASWPSPAVASVYVYNPTTNTFTQGAPMPRPRGAGGVAVHNGKIYYAGGLNNGIAVPWFDVYDPVANTWQQLPDMPRARDHFHAVVLNGKFWAIGGRNKDINATTTANDAYDFPSGSWKTGFAPLPTARGGFAATAMGGEIVVIGGEGGGKVFNTVEAYDPGANSWRALSPMPTARHGVQAAVCDGGIYIAGGGIVQGSGPTDVHEAFFLNGKTLCAP
ncbi:MAG: kelch repeat-containing protein [Gaiellaceae bacterium]